MEKNLEKLENGILTEKECAKVLNNHLDSQQYIEMSMNLRTEQKARKKTQKQLEQEESKVRDERQKHEKTLTENERLKKMLEEKDRQLES